MGAVDVPKYGVRYVASELSRSEIYLEALPLFSQGRIELLDMPLLRTQLLLLERRVRAGSRADSVDHPRGAHDDLANSACGALHLAVRRGGLRISESLLNDDGLGAEEPGWPPGWDVQAADAQPRPALAPGERYDAADLAKLLGVEAN